MNEGRWGKTVLAGIALLALAALARTADASPYPLAQIMDKPTADKLAAHKITTTTVLLERAAKRKQRRALAKKAKIAQAVLDRWVKVCDLLRINGVGPEMARLLGAARIKTVRSLRRQKAAKLHPRLIKVNKRAKITVNPPAQHQVKFWIDQAKKLPLVLR